MVLEKVKTTKMIVTFNLSIALNKKPDIKAISGYLKNLTT